MQAWFSLNSDEIFVQTEVELEMNEPKGSLKTKTPYKSIFASFPKIIFDTIFKAIKDCIVADI